MDECTFEELEHTAEIGIRVSASGPGALYACAARAVFSLLNVKPDRKTGAVLHELSVDSADAESLMVDWLGELLFLHETTGTVMAECRVKHWSPVRLEAEVAMHPPLQPPTMHIKAVTYHQLSIVETETGWEAVVFFDI